MPATQAVKAMQFTGARLLPKDGSVPTREYPVVLQPSTVYTLGQVLGLAGAAVNDVQTLTIGGTPTGGTFPLNGTHPVNGTPFSLTVNYNSTVVQTQALMDTALGGRLLTVGGGTLPGSTQTFTGVNAAAGMPIPLMTGSITGLSGGVPTFAMAHTTVGAVANSYGPYAPGLLASPTTAPTLAASGADGTLAVGDYVVSYTYVTASGESTESDAATIAVASTNHIAISSITGIPAGVVSVNVYLNGSLAMNQAVTSNATGAFNVLNMGTTPGVPPVTNGAYTGTIITAGGLCEFNCATDGGGNITIGATATTIVGDNIGGTHQTIPIWFAGAFDLTKLTGVDAKSLNDLKARIDGGTLAGGTGIFKF